MNPERRSNVAKWQKSLPLIPRAVLYTLIIGIPLYLFQSTRLQNFGVDWNIAFYPATILLLHGQNPYQIAQFHNPVWALVPMIPFALLGLNLGRCALFYFNLFSVIYIALRLRARSVAFVAFVLSPFLYYYLFLGNIDTLVLWGMFMPPMIGLFFATIKPQVGIGIMAYWAYTMWRQKGILKALLVYLPITMAFVGSFLLFGNWTVDKSDHLLYGAYWNVSFFPWSVPIGVLLTAIAIRNSMPKIAVAASPFMTPYLSLGTWSFALMALLEHNLLMTAVVGGTWLLYILNQLMR
jgi:hypothetical protein